MQNKATKASSSGDKMEALGYVAAKIIGDNGMKALGHVASKVIGNLF